ncbi:MAG: hypothetical protein KDD64_07960 [Bdellovibrionales bacterium]|nr:hypothetical protein [Bdellovibrionales bacterium]
MKQIVSVILFTLFSLLAVSQSAFAATDADKAFLDTYKKAYEAKDVSTLKSLLYTKDAHPEALEFYSMMLTEDFSGKITSIELKDLTPEEQKEAVAVTQSPAGENIKLNLEPTKKLELKLDYSDANGTGSSTSGFFVALSDGKYVIPVPSLVK